MVTGYSDPNRMSARSPASHESMKTRSSIRSWPSEGDYRIYRDISAEQPVTGVNTSTDEVRSQCASFYYDPDDLDIQ